MSWYAVLIEILMKKFADLALRIGLRFRLRGASMSEELQRLSLSLNIN